MKLLTANRLIDGTIVWYTNDGWAEDAALAARLSDDVAEEALKTALASETQFAGAYLIPLNDHDAPVQREMVREYIRANGPTVGPTQFDTAKTFDRAIIFEAK
jgi:hypothetical protein